MYSQFPSQAFGGKAFNASSRRACSNWQSNCIPRRLKRQFFPSQLLTDVHSSSCIHARMFLPVLCMFSFRGWGRGAWSIVELVEVRVPSSSSRQAMPCHPCLPIACILFSSVFTVSFLRFQCKSLRLRYSSSLSPPPRIYLLKHF